MTAHSLVDPKLLVWLYEPHLVQRDESVLDGYGLQELAARYGLSDGATEMAAARMPPLRRLHHDLKVRVFANRW